MKTIFLFLASLASGLMLAQNVHTVDNNTPSVGDFTTIGDAIAAASPGDTIYVIPSTVDYGNFTITKLLHFRGAGHAPEYNSNQGAVLGNITLNIPIGGSGLTFSGLIMGNVSVTGSQQAYSSLEFINNRFNGRITAGSGQNQCNNWIIIGNVFSASTPDLINKNNSNGWLLHNNYIRQEGASATWSMLRNFNSSDVVRNNIFVNAYTNNPGSLFNSCIGLTVENSLFLFNGNSTGINLSGNTVTFNNCLSYSYPGQSLDALPGDNNLDNQDPLLVSIGANPYYSPSKNFALQPESPGAAYGTDGQDIGLYGSNFNFSPRGYPSDLPYITKMEVTNAVVGQGGTLNVEFEAQAQ